jgi:hypothetical protein
LLAAPSLRISPTFNFSVRGASIFLLLLQLSINSYLVYDSDTYFKMRALTEDETKTLFQKLANYTGRSLNQLIQPTEDNERYVFRIQGSRVYYVKQSIANLATSVARDNLLSLGVCVGKFTKTMKFRLHITA